MCGVVEDCPKHSCTAKVVWKQCTKDSMDSSMNVMCDCCGSMEVRTQINLRFAQKRAVHV